ncbi:MAG: hypothetical protein SFU84_00815 [Gemmatimonadales bacterium]|nr:hypothetical protein [Gemmatimonadales bacterium]
MSALIIPAVLFASLFAAPLAAQTTAMPAGHQHTEGMVHPAAAKPTEAGQDAFAAMAEIVKLLDADPATDWSKVDLEALRRHLVDMNVVTLKSAVQRTQVAGGLSMDVTGDAATAQSIQRMVTNHAKMVDAMPDLMAKTTLIPGGVRFVVTAENPNDVRTVARIRGLGFGGILVLGDHHTAHHLQIAKGEGGSHNH